MRVEKIKDIPLNKRVRVGGTIGNRWMTKAEGIFKREGDKTIFYNDDNFSFCVEDEVAQKDMFVIGIEGIKGD